MSEAIEAIKYNTELYYGDFWFLGIAMVAFIYLAVTSKDLREKFLFSVGLMLFCVVNPVLYKYVFSDIIYWRMFWTVPDAMIVALAVTKFVRNRKSNVLKLLILSVIVCIMVKFGKTPFEERAYEGVKNWYKLDSEVIEVCDIILGIDESPRCVMPKGLYSEVRQYSEDIELLYGRNAGWYMIPLDIYDNENYIYNEMEKKSPDYNMIFDVAEFEGCNIVVCEIKKAVDEKILQNNDYLELARTDKYIVYYKELSDESNWLITQYGHEGSAEYTFYTIEDKKGHLIVIDGGNARNKDYLKNVISSKGCQVDAWFITTPKSGHMDAVTELLLENDIVVDEIYMPNIDYKKYKESLKDIKGIECYDEFLDATEEFDNITFVYEGDTIELFGLKFNIYNAWGENINLYRDNYTSVGSLVFSVEGEKESMLFLSDGYITSKDNKLLNKLGKNVLDYDYIQVANHGNRDFEEEYYCGDNAKVVFIDVYPDKIKYENYKMNYNELIDYLDDMDVDVYTFDLYPNSILFR